MQASMLSTALRNKHEAAAHQQVPGSTRPNGRPRGRGIEKPPTQHLKAVSQDPEAAEAAEGLGDVAGLPIGRMPDGEEDSGAGTEKAESATPAVEPSLSDYSTIGAYLHELRRYPLMTREEEHTVAVRFCKDHATRAPARGPCRTGPRP